MTPPDSLAFPDTIVAAHGLSQHVATGNGMLDILTDVSLAVKAGETLAILGASGSGKSTLLGLLAGLDRASSGEVWLLGKRLNDLDEDARARLRASRVGFVFQSFQLLPALTALENILLPLELAGANNARERGLHWLDRVGLAARAHHTPRQLSGGEQQRIAIARAFATDPQLLFADEPTGNLDADTGARIIDLLFELNASAHTTLVLVTHDTALAARCKRSLQLLAGRVQVTSPT
ncbi:MAG: ABC transporter ATP-binding protein [Thiobacillaceae bacterium]